MAREVYTDERFIQFSSRFVFMRVLADTDEEGAELQRRYKVLGFPTLLVLDSRGDEIDRLEGGRTTEELIEDLGFIFQYASEDKVVNLVR
jgi:thioredoxin-related protein